MRPIHVASKNLDDIGTLYAHSREKMCRCVGGGRGYDPSEHYSIRMLIPV